MIQRVLDLAFGVSETHERRPIRAITIEIGVLQQILPSALELAFEAVTRGTPAEGARLEWRVVPLELRCRACDLSYMPLGDFWVCPRCACARATPVHGNELNLIQVELLDASPGDDP